MSRHAVVLVAHGSRDPRAAAATTALADAVAAAHPEWVVHPSYLDHAGPRPLEVLRWLAASGHRRATVVPLLLTSAYHGRVDIPAVLAEARDLPIEITLSGVLGPATGDRPPVSVVPVPEGAVPQGMVTEGRVSEGRVSEGRVSEGRVSEGRVSDLLVDALVRHLPSDAGLDGVVLIAAGTRVAAARAGVEDAAAALGARLGLPCRVAYASAAPPTAAEAVASFGGGRIGVASYFLAPGLLHDSAERSARSAGAVTVTPPLQDAPELVELIARRVHEAAPRRLAAA